MPPIEIETLRRDQLWAAGGQIGVLAMTMAVFTALLLILADGNQFHLYEFGDACQSDCGQAVGHSLQCLEGDGGEAYCSRRCGTEYPACPESYRCAQLMPADAEGAVQESAAAYCVREGSSLAGLAGSVAGQAERALDGQEPVTLLSFEPIVIYIPYEAELASALTTLSSR